MIIHSNHQQLSIAFNYILYTSTSMFGENVWKSATKCLAKFPLVDSSDIVVEMDQLVTSDTIRGSHSDDVIDEAKRTLGHALNAIRALTECIINKLQDLNHRPDEIEM